MCKNFATCWKHVFWPKNCIFYQNLRTLNMYALASSGFRFRRSKITRNDKKILCIRQNYVLVEFFQTILSCTHVSLQALELSLTMLTEEEVRSQDQTSFNVLACQLLSHKLWLHLRYYHCLTFIHCLAVFVFGDFYELFSVKASENFM